MIAFVALLASLARAEVPTIGLDQALEQASTESPRVVAAAAGVDVADARLWQARGARLPLINVQGQVQVYDSEQTLQFISSDEDIDCSSIPDPFGSMCSGFTEPIVIREQVTSAIQVRAIEPITGQLAIDRRVAAARAGVAAGEASFDAAVADARYEAADAYYSALQAERQLEIAQAQLKSLENRARTAEAAAAAGLMTRNDQLQVQIALSQAKQAVLQLTVLRDSAYARLGAAIGNGGHPVRPVGASEAPPRPVPDVDALVERAIAERPDLAALQAQVDAADAAAAATAWALLPSINAMAVGQHTEGQGAFGLDNQVYVGATIDWNLWAWGQGAKGVQASRATADQARAQLAAVESGVRVEVSSRARMIEASGLAYEVAEATIGQAEENLAIMERKFEAGSGTVSDVLDAEAALVRARSARANALYDARRAEAALERAVGGDPWAR